MYTSSGLYSVKSDKLDDEMLYIKRKNEHYAYILGIIAQFIWALNSIQLKTYQPNFPQAFSNNSLVFWRSLPIWVLGYIFCRQKNVKIKPLSQIKHKFWFVSRSFGNYVSIFLWIKILSYFRVSTGQVIASCYPILVLFLSVLILHETFYFRYIIGVLICILGSAIIVMNERSPEARKTVINNNPLIGLCFAMAHLLVNGFSGLGQKIQCKDQLTPDEQNYYLGMYNTLPALILCIFEMHFGFSSILYILYAISNGLIIFYTANYIQTKALEYIAVSKFMPVTYSITVFVFLFGVTILHEPLFLTDILGAGLIIGFQIYNIYYPPGRKINEENLINDENKKKESNVILEVVDENVLHENLNNSRDNSIKE